MKGELQLEPSGAQNPSDSDPLLENQQVDSPSSSSESSSKIKNADVEAGSVACCRICLEYDGEEGLILMLRLSIFYFLFFLCVGFDYFE